MEQDTELIKSVGERKPTRRIISLILDEETLRRIDAVARWMDRSKFWTINRFIAHWINEYAPETASELEGVNG